MQHLEYMNTKPPILHYWSWVSMKSSGAMPRTQPIDTPTTDPVNLAAAGAAKPSITVVYHLLAMTSCNLAQHKEQWKYFTSPTTRPHASFVGSVIEPLHLPSHILQQHAFQPHVGFESLRLAWRRCHNDHLNPDGHADACNV